MLKVLIVDDEIIVRVGLKACIEWNKIGYEVVGMSENGSQALALVDELNPDVIFTDIKMPEMDGLELTSEVHKRFPWIKIIILSCLNEIDYVKQAIKLGAEDYILKLSLKTDELVELLKKIKVDIETGLANDSQTTEVRTVKQEFIREQAYRRLLTGTIFQSDKKDLFEQLNFTNSPEENFIILCCKIDDYEHAGIKSNLTNHNLLKFAFINMLEEFLKDYSFAEAVEIDNGEFIIFIKYKCSTNIMSEMSTYVHRLNSALKTHLNISASFGVSELFNDYNCIIERYKEAKEALSYKFLYGKESFLTASVFSLPIETNHSLNSNLEDSIIEAVKMQNKNTASKVIDDWVTQIRRIPGVSPMSIKLSVIEAWLSLSRFLREQKIDEKSVLLEPREVPSNVLMNIETLDEACEYLKSVVCKSIDAIVIGKVSRPEIAVLKKYISQHIEENLSLEDAARICGISRTYFSSLFKKETGEHFSDYLNRMKMEKAKELILLKNMRSNEAAYHVGIIDESYFSKLFRKYLGFSPSQIKRMEKDKS